MNEDSSVFKQQFKQIEHQILKLESQQKPNFERSNNKIIFRFLENEIYKQQLKLEPAAMLDQVGRSWVQIPSIFFQS